MINLSFAVTYGATGLMGVDGLSSRLFMNIEALNVLVGSLCLFSYLIVLVGYKMGAMLGSKITISSPRIHDKAVERSCILAFGVGLLSIFAYSSSYGGIVRSIEFAAAIRSGNMNSIEGGNYLFMKNLLPLLIFLPMLSFSKICKQPSTGQIALFLGCTSVALVGLFMMAGRGRIAVFLIVLTIIYSRSDRGKMTVTPLSLVVIAVVLFLLDFYLTYGKELFRYFYSSQGYSNGGLLEKSYSPLGTVLSYYNHRVSSIFYALTDSSYSPTFFYDAFLLPLYVMPDSIIGFRPPDSISYINTFLHTGVWDSTIPPGLVAYGVYSLGVIGVLLSSLVYGFVPGVLDKKLRKEAGSDKRDMYRLPMLIIWIVYFLQGDPRVFAVNMFPCIFLFFLIYSFGLLRRVRF